MKRWVITGTIDPSKLEGVVTSRCGRFVAYSRVLRRWYWVYPGGEKWITQPTEILVDVNKDLSLTDKPIKAENPPRARKKAEQLELLF